MSKSQFLYILLLNMILEIKSEFTLNPSISEYYPEKYFRFLANNYDSISQGDTWTTIGTEQGIGFEANEDFGSFLLVKDWSMYSFKLRKVVFRPYCSYNLNDNEGNNFCDAEMLLYHTIDNNYYPPGRRIHLGINYLVISVPFKKSTLMNPANDKLFQFLQLDMLKEIVSRNQSINNVFPKISPFKPIKLYQIIQHQPSYLFENELIPGSKIRALYLVFSKFHYISQLDFNNLEAVFNTFFPEATKLTLKNSTDTELNQIISDKVIYRNWDNARELEPSATLMAYNNCFYIKFKEILFFVFLIFLI